MPIRRVRSSNQGQLIASLRLGEEKGAFTTLYRQLTRADAIWSLVIEG